MKKINGQNYDAYPITLLFKAFSREHKATQVDFERVLSIDIKLSRQIIDRTFSDDWVLWDRLHGWVDEVEESLKVIAQLDIIRDEFNPSIIVQQWLQMECSGGVQILC